MNAREALTTVRGLASANRYMLTSHAYDEMIAAGAQREEVHSALVNARRSKRDGAGWVVTGPDRDGDELTMKVVLEDDMLVITVW